MAHLAGRAAVRSVAAVTRLVRSPLQRWRAYWDVDHAASQFRDLDAAAEEMEAVAEHNEELKKEAVKAYANEHIWPRVALGEGLKPMLLPPTAEAAAQRSHGFSDRNRAIFLGSISFLPLLVVLGWALSLYLQFGGGRKPPASPRSGAVLDKRVASLEGQIAALTQAAKDAAKEAAEAAATAAAAAASAQAAPAASVASPSPQLPAHGPAGEDSETGADRVAALAAQVQALEQRLQHVLAELASVAGTAGPGMQREADGAAGHSSSPDHPAAAAIVEDGNLGSGVHGGALDPA